MSKCVILCTAGDENNAKAIASNLVNERLAACVNIMNVSSSIYRFEGKIYDEPEFLLVIKTKKELFEKVGEAILKLHNYTLPEIIMLPVDQGFAPYLNWIDNETTSNV